MKKILSVFMALCTVLTTLCIPPAPVTAQSTKMLISEQIDQAVTLPVEEESITLETLTEDCKILQYVDEEAFEAADHAFRLPHLEELDTYVFQNQDGTRSIYYLYENVKYIDEQGNIREKDNTLQRETKGFRITENAFDLLLPHAVTDGVELTYQDYDVKLVPAMEGKLTATAPGALQENSVVYESFYGAGTSLVYTPLLSGVKEEIILEEYLPNKSFSFLLYTDGLFLNNTDGSYILTESKTATEAVLYLGDIVVYDAIGRPSLGNLTVETIKDGNIYALTVSADEGFLSDPATVYPVTIDPDITISDTDNGSGAIEDTTLFSGTPNLNTGDWVYNTAGYVDETYGAGRILVRLPGLYNDEVYQGLTADRILSATFYTTKSSSKTPDYVNLYRCTDTAWSENSVAWNYHANLYTNSTNWGTSSVSSSAVTFNITSLVKAWRSGTYSAQAGFMLINQNETDVTKKFGIYSSEHSNTEKRPYFVLNYEADIVLDKAELEVKLGTFGTLNATTSPANQQVSWRSSNEAVASVTPSGVVAPHHAGTTTITAWFTDSDGFDHEAQCTVYVALEDGIYCFDNEYASYRVGLQSLVAYQAGAMLYETPGISSLPTERHQFFKVTHLGAGLYSIRSMLDVTLGWDHGGYNPTCEDIGTSKTTVPLDAQWYIRYDSGGDCYSIYGNTGLGGGDMSRTLTCSGAVDFYRYPTLQGYSASNASQDWQITKLTYSGSGIELRRKTSYRTVGDPFTFTATVYSSLPDEFGQGEMTWAVVNGSAHASVSADGELTGNLQGAVTVRVSYTTSNSQVLKDFCSLDIETENGKILREVYGFSAADARLICLVYDRVDSLYASETSFRRSWISARLIGGLYYNENYIGTTWNFLWNQIAGEVFSSSEQTYFVNVLGFSPAQYIQLSQAVVEEHRDQNTLDFAHMQMALAARLAYQIDEHEYGADIMSTFVGEDISYLGGWLGDAVLDDGNGTSMGNDDYCSDLDAENVFRRIIDGYSLQDAFRLYYNSLSVQNNRANVFLSYISYDLAKNKIFYYLVDAELYYLKDQALANREYGLVEIYQGWLFNEQYHWNKLRIEYPDTYCFLLSLRDGRATIGDYLEET